MTSTGPFPAGPSHADGQAPGGDQVIAGTSALRTPDAVDRVLPALVRDYLLVMRGAEEIALAGRRAGG